MDFTGERFIPDAISGEIAVEHFQRYKAIQGLIKGKKVLDIACGEGYGSFLLADVANSVVGIDIDADAVSEAQEKYKRTNLRYMEGSATSIALPDHSMDVIVSFETIEHITAEDQIAFLLEVKRVLMPDGIFIVSTPDKKVYSDARNYVNSFHKKEFYFDEFRSFLAQYFTEIQFLRQGTVENLPERRIGIISEENTPIKNILDFSISNESPLLYILGICTNASLKKEDITNCCSLYFGINDNRVPTDLFFDRGQGFSHSDKIMRSVSAQNNVFTVEYTILNTQKDIQRLRFDPIPDASCCLSIKEIHSNIAQMKVSFPDAIMDDNGDHWYVSMDPGIVLDGEFSDNIDFRIIYSLTILDQSDLIRHFSYNVFQCEKQRTILAQQRARLEKQQQQIEELHNELENTKRVLQKIKSSNGWQLLKKLWKIRDALIPMNSKRRIVAKLMYKTAQNPSMMISKLNADNMCKLVYYMRTESPADVEQRMEMHVPLTSSDQSNLKLFPLESVMRPFLSDYEKIIFPVFERIKVSIIIPAYNEFSYTYNCLRAILENTSNVCYEVILADDNSSDYTKDIASVVEHMTIVHNEDNMRFLKNCNNAAKHTQGEYILFLNNDTQVQPGWLDALTGLLDSDETIGMTGSKLVYPNGRLQEAGGICWKDGTAWNYGHGDDPDKPEYNYVKDVDYISGASIMIRKSLWQEIGGFDERFAPAYCEDSDLAFAVRKAGYRVVYQPKSVVVHFEGVSNGTDLKSGVKKYQVENQEKFCCKWQEVLEKEHFFNGQEVFLARDRSRDKKTILVIDHYVPHYDCDAGGRTTFNYLNFFVQMGMQVVFVGDNFFKHEPYTTVLNQLGIETLVGNGWNFKIFVQWLDTNGKYLDFVYLNRPHISIKYIDLVKERTKAKIIYYGHDLHFIREQRQYEIEKTPTLLKSIEHWKKIECELFTKADVIHTPGTYEQEFLQKMFPDKPIRAIPIYLYDRKELEGMGRPVTIGRDFLLFVGGFGHQPNEDALRWFVEKIYPHILEKKPGTKLFVVGSHPTKYVQSLQSDLVTITGYVSDEELADYYGRARVSVVPLRYGAGIKGKIVETMHFGLPAVTTPIGAEGLPGVEKCIEVVAVGEAEQYAERVLTLLQDDKLWLKESKLEMEYIRMNFTTDRAKEILLQDMK